MRTSRPVLLLSLLLPLAALAQNPLAEEEQKAPQPLPEAAKPAAEVLTRYLDAVKAKKWKEAKKLTHKKTLAAIAERKKRLGNEEHPMAPWYFVKSQSWLKDYRVMNAKEGPLGTWIFETSEDNYQVQEKGVAVGDMATYLVGKVDGKWMVVDKKRGVTFTRDSVKYGYRSYFDKPAEEKEEE